MQLEGVGQSIVGNLIRFGQHQFQLIELVVVDQRVVDICDQHILNGGAFVVRTQAGNLLMAHPDHDAAGCGLAGSRRCTGIGRRGARVGTARLIGNGTGGQEGGCCTADGGDL